MCEKQNDVGASQRSIPSPRFTPFLGPLANLHPFLICTLSFPFNANWLVYVQLFGLLFL